MRRVLLAVDASSPDLTDDDRVLASAMRARGIEPVPLRWGDPVDPGAVVTIRSTWDYVEQPHRFATWLDHLDAQDASVLNPTPVLRWNMHKAYLLDLDRRGVPIVPTALLARHDARSLDDVRAAHGWDEVVVKPAIGGTARLTVHSGRMDDRAAHEHLRRLLTTDDVIVQPVVDAVVSEGEVSVVAIGGEPSAAVVKRPAPDEWRVQSDFGGTTERIDLDDDLVDVARTALHGTVTDYARVDVVRHRGRWVVLELELVEPELFFLLEPGLADRFVDRLVDRLPGAI